MASPRDSSQRELGASPFTRRLAPSHRPNRVPQRTDGPLTSCCSPPRVTTTQLQSVTSYVDLERTFTPPTRCALRRTSASARCRSFPSQLAGWSEVSTLASQLVGGDSCATEIPASKVAGRKAAVRQPTDRAPKLRTVFRTSCMKHGHEHYGCVTPGLRPCPSGRPLRVSRIGKKGRELSSAKNRAEQF